MGSSDSLHIADLRDKSLWYGTSRTFVRGAWDSRRCSLPAEQLQILRVVVLLGEGELEHRARAIFTRTAVITVDGHSKTSNWERVLRESQWNLATRIRRSGYMFPRPCPDTAPVRKSEAGDDEPGSSLRKGTVNRLQPEVKLKY